MPPFPSSNSNHLDSGIGQDSSSSSSTPPKIPVSAALDLAIKTCKQQQQAMHAGPQDPHACYKAFIDADASATGSGQDPVQEADVIGPQHDRFVGFQQQCRARAVPSSPAVRYENRSNGVPLATITEQYSYSTLSSHGSLLGVDLTTSRVTAERSFRNRITDTSSHCLNANVLQRYQEGVTPGEGVSVGPEICGESAQENRQTSRPFEGTAVPFGPGSFQPPQFPRVQGGYTNCDLADGDFRCLLRDVLQNVRSAPQNQCQKPSLVRTSFVESWKHEAETSKCGPQCQLHNSKTLQASRDKFDASQLVQTSFTSAACAPNPDSQVRNRKTLTTTSKASAHAIPPLLNASPPKIESKIDFVSVLHPLSPSVATRSCEQSSFVRLVQPEPRDEAHDDGIPVPLTLSIERRPDTSAQYTFDGVPVPRKSAPSLAVYDRARESSRNASFCSTVSTSYSGTVLGVDVDLQHKVSHLVQRSRSPTPPAWFTPRMAEMRRKASRLDAPESELSLLPTSLRRSITSSALTALLPIAAASGIVQSNYTTPKISFYSPSGNLIHPEGDSTPGTSTSNLTATCNLTAYNNDIHTTSIQNPPLTIAALPTRYKHERRKRSHDKAYESCVVLYPVVKGCDGVIRNKCPLQSRLKDSELESQYHPHIKDYKPTRTSALEAKCKAHLCKPQVFTLASPFQIRSSHRKWPQERHTQSENNANIGISTTRHCDYLNRKSHNPMDNQTTQSQHKVQRQGLLGPLIEQVLRACSRQPHDNPGKGMHHITIRKTATNSSVKPIRCGRLMDIDRDMPNARIIRGDNRGRGSRSETRATNHRRTRNDSAVGIGG